MSKTDNTVLKDMIITMQFLEKVLEKWPLREVKS